MPETVLTRIEDGVGIITLNRPDRLNAMSREAGELFETKMAALGVDPAVKVMVITGAGERGFCAGADMERLQDIVDGGAEGIGSRRAPGAAGPLEVFADAPPMARARYVSPIAAPKPVIAAINGACAGVGFSLAAACDIRFASSTAVFAAGFARRGLIAESAVAWTLPRIVGQGAAAELLLSGRKFDAAEALRLGLVSAVLAPEDLLTHTLAYAREIALSASPRSTAVIKRQLRLAMDQTFEEAMAFAEGQTVASLESEDFKEGVASFREKRAPRFTGR